MSDCIDSLEHMKSECLKACDVNELSSKARLALQRYVDDVYDHLFLKNQRVFTKYRCLTDEDIEYLLDRIEDQEKLIRSLQDRLHKIEKLK